MDDSLLQRQVAEFLRRWPGLRVFCTQDGWIDNDTLSFEIQQANEREVLVAVRFEEILMEGSGCVAGREPCFGKLRLKLDADGSVRSAEPW
ncbi:hypothetical protein [Methylomarinovum tepidoasis]|nr:hypothetical protein [Methylomarinovum sp. IN45]